MLNAIDWPNIVATVAAAVLGGWIASRVAQRQIHAAQAAERDKARRDVARDLIESVDSYLHIAYRGGDQERLERQRLRRRILSLTAIVLPDRFAAMQEHLDLVERWWRAKSNPAKKPRGVGYSATEAHFIDLKQAVFVEVFGARVQLSRSEDDLADPGGEDALPF